MPAAPDWNTLQDRLLQGDRTALLEVSRLVTRALVGLRAYDFSDEWDDLRQEVLVSVIQNARAGRLRETGAFPAYVRIITRNKFADRLRQSLRVHEKTALPWDDLAELRALPAREAAPDTDDIWAEVAKLGPQERVLIVGIYREGKTYEELAAETGVPLGTTKRRLREALDLLRSRFARDGLGVQK